MRLRHIFFLAIVFVISKYTIAQPFPELGLYRTFERSLENDSSYSNKYTDVELNCTFTSPTGVETNFFGFFDGNGDGGGDLRTGNIWKFRFLPNEIGKWNYTWSWSDGTPGGVDSFMCVSENAGKGILKPYENNPRWFAYNGTDPVWIKSYYESGHGAIAQPFDWIAENVYQPLIDRGYNHLQVNWLLSLCCFSQYYDDGPDRSTTDLTLYEDGKASSTMKLNVWQMMEQHISWLNDRNIGLHMFLGFDGGRNGGPAWTSLSESEKDFYIRYVIARLAPYANIAGWSYVWEVPGDREDQELGWARLVQKYDVFNHLRTYQDEKPKYNEFSRPEYNFAGVENHRIHSDNREPEYWSAPWTHHEACLLGYVPGKPVYMVEGNALWRRYWAAKIKKETGKDVTLDEVRQSAWGCATAAASFTWCGHQGEGPLMAYGPQGMPFHGDENKYARSALEIDILTDIMNNDLAFYRMEPADSLLSEHDSRSVWCLAEPGEQYLVFSKEANPFKLQFASGQYNSNQWINARTGAGIVLNAFAASDNEVISFTPPDAINDWALLIRKEWEQNIRSEAYIVSAETDAFGKIVTLTCNKEINESGNHPNAFVIKVSNANNSIEKISFDPSKKETITIELVDTIYTNEEIRLSYSGTLTATDTSVLTPVNDLIVKNNSAVEKVVISSVSNTIGFKCSLYPNPSSGNIEISSNIKINTIEVFNITGKSVLKLKNVEQTKKQIQIADLPQGMYLLSITSANSTIVRKFMKN